jgi:hypothetical protein
MVNTGDPKFFDFFPSDITLRRCFMLFASLPMLANNEWKSQLGFFFFFSCGNTEPENYYTKIKTPWQNAREREVVVVRTDSEI